MIKKIVKEMTHIYENININYDILKKLENEYIHSLKRKNVDIKIYPLIRYKIRDIFVRVYKNINEEISLEDTDTYDIRIWDIYKMIENTLKYMKKNNKTINNTSLYIWISDRFPWYIENLSKSFPIYVFAKPKKNRLYNFS